ncbi:MAG: N-acetylmuramoyl-L-alanine amidase [Pseudomonadota bacterium]|nr:N-acetylmuramoyl-L-alanine amidase [Pseudomonadota bacterium]
MSELENESEEIVKPKSNKWKRSIVGGVLVATMLFRFAGRLEDMVTSVIRGPEAISVGMTAPMPKSVHFAERMLPVRHIVVHSFSLPTDKMIARLNELGLSTHYLIDTKGKVTKLVPEDKVAWHAGPSFWRGTVGLNATSIGIELQNNTLGQTPFTNEQLTAFQILARDLIYRYRIDPKNIVAHSDIAPARKVDVGHAFPWQKMAKMGIGVWPSGKMSQNMSQNIGELLRQIGYDTTDEDKALLAFERRFMPELIQKDPHIASLEENLHHQKPVRNATVIRRLNEVAEAYK